MTASSTAGGDYTFPLYGVCLPPKPQVTSETLVIDKRNSLQVDNHQTSVLSCHTGTAEPKELATRQQTH